MQHENIKKTIQRKENIKQSFFSSTTTFSKSKSVFYTDLCLALICSVKPLFKLQNSDLKMFLEKYTGQSIPDESTLRKNYIRNICFETLSLIRGVIQDGPIWVSIDETTDVKRGLIGNVVIGKLCGEPTNPILLNCEQLKIKSSDNSKTV